MLSKLFLQSFVITLISIFSFSCKNDSRKDNKTTALLESPVQQQVQFKDSISQYSYDFTRKFPFKLKLLNRVDDFENVDKFQINNYHKEDGFWIINGSTKKIEYYNLNFKKERSFGEIGEGPQEFLQPYFFFVDQDKILVHDFQQHALKEVSLKDFSVKQFEFKQLFYSPAFFSDRKFLFNPVNDDKNAPFTFVLYDLKTKTKVKQFILENELQVEHKNYMRQVYDGDFRQNSTYSVYFNYCTGWLFVYSNIQHKFISKIQTIDKTPSPNAYWKEVGGGIKVLVKDPPKFWFLDGFVDSDNTFFLLNEVTKKGSVIDVYDLESLKNNNYLYSISLPDLEDGQKASHIFKINNYLIVYYNDQTIIRYEIIKK